MAAALVRTLHSGTPTVAATTAVKMHQGLPFGALYVDLSGTVAFTVQGSLDGTTFIALNIGSITADGCYLIPIFPYMRLNVTSASSTPLLTAKIYQGKPAR